MASATSRIARAACCQPVTHCTLIKLLMVHDQSRVCVQRTLAAGDDVVYQRRQWTVDNTRLALRPMEAYLSVWSAANRRLSCKRGTYTDQTTSSSQWIYEIEGESNANCSHIVRRYNTCHLIIREGCSDGVMWSLRSVVLLFVLSLKSVCLSVCLSVSRITHERVNGRRPNMVAMGKGWSTL